MYDARLVLKSHSRNMRKRASVSQPAIEEICHIFRVSRLCEIGDCQSSNCVETLDNFPQITQTEYAAMNHF